MLPLILLRPGSEKYKFSEVAVENGRSLICFVSKVVDTSARSVIREPL